MMGMQVAPAQLFYDFCLDDDVPADHLLRRIDRFLDLESVRTALKPFYSSIGRPSVDPELMMRMLIVGYCMGLRSERRLCEEVHLKAQWTGAMRGPAFFAYATNYLIDTEHAIILDVEATRAIRQAEVGASRTMFERTAERFGLKPQHLAADSAYGSADNLAWLVKEKQIAPYIPVIDKANRTDGTLSRVDFVFDPDEDHYTCPGGKQLVQYRRSFATPRTGITKDGIRFYRARQSNCQSCDLKARCCPNTLRRRIPRNLDEDARDVARALAGTPAFERSRHSRKKIEMLFAHLKRILKLARLRLRGPSGARDESCWQPRLRT